MPRADAGARLTVARTSHYVRFAQAIALVGGALTPGCYAAHVRPGDAPDAAIADAATHDTGPINPCASCDCNRGPGTPTSCQAMGHYECCATLGPLPPPDLPA